MLGVSHGAILPSEGLKALELILAEAGPDHLQQQQTATATDSSSARVRGRGAPVMPVRRDMHAAPPSWPQNTEQASDTNTHAEHAQQPRATAATNPQDRCRSTSAHTHTRQHLPPPQPSPPQQPKPTCSASEKSDSRSGRMLSTRTLAIAGPSSRTGPSAASRHRAVRSLALYPAVLLTIRPSWSLVRLCRTLLPAQIHTQQQRKWGVAFARPCSR